MSEPVERLVVLRRQIVNLLTRWLTEAEAVAMVAEFADRLDAVRQSAPATEDEVGVLAAEIASLIEHYGADSPSLPYAIARLGVHVERTAPLDVERLARALRAIEDEQGIYWGPVVGEDPYAHKAAAIAREYAALAPHPDPEPTDHLEAPGR